MSATNHCNPLTAIASCAHCYCKDAEQKCCEEASCPANAKKVCCKCGAVQLTLSEPWRQTPWPYVQPYRPWWGIYPPSDGTSDRLTGTATFKADQHTILMH